MPTDDLNQLTSVVLKLEEDYCNEVDHAYVYLRPQTETIETSVHLQREH